MKIVVMTDVHANLPALRAAIAVIRAEVRGRAHYVNPGALGCHSEPVARYAVATYRHGDYAVEHRAVAYDGAPLFAAFEQRRVPERDFIRRAFFGWP